VLPVVPPYAFCFEFDFRLIELNLFGSCQDLPYRKTVGDFLFSDVDFVFADFKSRLYQLPLHQDICSTIRPSSNRLRSLTPVMEAFRAAHIVLIMMILWLNWGGY
jgi:hypothetical protein